MFDHAVMLRFIPPESTRPPTAGGLFGRAEFGAPRTSWLDQYTEEVDACGERRRQERRTRSGSARGPEEWIAVREPELPFPGGSPTFLATGRTAPERPEGIGF